MEIIWLSTGWFRERYGQQNYESAVFACAYDNYGNDCNFRVFLLNDRNLNSFADNFSKVKFLLFGRKNRFLSKLALSLSFILNVIKKRPDLIVCCHMNLSGLCYMVSRAFGLRYIIVAYGMDVWNRSIGPRTLAMTNSFLVVTMSRFTAAMMAKQAPAVKDKTFVIPAYVDTDRFSIKPKDTFLMEKYGLFGSKVILTVARLSRVENKGCKKVIEALPEVIKSVGKVKYILVGEGDEIPQLKERAEELGMEEQVIFTGFVDNKDLAPFYSLCDVFVMPSSQEGFGIVYVEALASGKTVIAGNQDGSREALSDGRLGILIDPQEQSQLTAALIDVLRHNIEPRLYDPLFLRESAKEEFSYDVFNRRVKEVFGRILN